MATGPSPVRRGNRAALAEAEAKLSSRREFFEFKRLALVARVRASSFRSLANRVVDEDMSRGE